MPPEAPKTEAPKTEQSFDDAFAEALASDTKAEDTAAGAAGTTAQDPPSGDKSPAGNDTDAAAAATEGAAEARAAAEGEAAAAAVEAAAAEDPAKKAAPSAAPAAPAAAAGETPEQEVARLRAENAALNAVARIAEKSDKPAAAEPAAPAVPAVPAEPKWYQPAPEEVERVQAFQKEWPDIHEAVQTLLKQAGYNAAEYVFHTIAKVYNPTLQEFSELSKTIQEQLTLGALRSEHSDYDSIYDNVVAWVDTLSPAFKRGAQQVMKDGTPDEVNDLIAAYKETDAFKLQAAAQGGAKQAAPPAAGGAPTPAPAPAGLSAAAKKAAGKLQVVGSKRTTPVAPADANDFDGAWAEAMRSN